MCSKFQLIPYFVISLPLCQYLIQVQIRISQPTKLGFAWGLLRVVTSQVGVGPRILILTCLFFIPPIDLLFFSLLAAADHTVLNCLSGHVLSYLV